MILWWAITAIACTDCIPGATAVQSGGEWTWMCPPHAMAAVTAVTLRTEL